MLISEYRHCPRLPSDLDIRKRTREQGSNSAEYEETHALFHRGKICSDVQTPFQFELRTPQKIRFQKTKLRALDLPSVPAWSVCLSVCLSVIVDDVLYCTSTVVDPPNGGKNGRYQQGS